MKPGKQRKQQTNAPLHLKQKALSVHLPPELRAKYKTRSVQVKKGDVVTILVGKYKGKDGKVTKVSVKDTYVNIENLKIKKTDGKEVYIRFTPSNLLMKELLLDDNKRLKSLKRVNDNGK